MSFSEEVKEELCRVRTQNACCVLSELSAVTQSTASLALSGGRFCLIWRMEHIALARRVLTLLKQHLDVSAQMEYTLIPQFGGRRICELKLDAKDSEKVLLALGMMKADGSGFNLGARNMSSGRKCCRGAYLRGFFLSSGYLLTPEKGYRLEIILDSREKAEAVQHILQMNGIWGAACRQQKEKFHVTTESGDEVIAALTVMGAVNAMMRMENIRIEKESKNRANRAFNCDQSNLRKQLAKAKAEADMIGEYLEAHTLEELPEKLRAVARARMENPTASLEELAQALPSPITKSGLYHRMQQLMKLIG